MFLGGQEFFGDRVQLRFITSQQRKESKQRTLDGENCLVLRLQLMLPVTPMSSVEEFYPLGEPRVSIKVLMDKDIKGHLENNGSIDILGFPASTVYIYPPPQSLKAVKHAVTQSHC